MDIAGKVFIVTGAASAWAKAQRRMLAREGAKVVIADPGRSAAGGRRRDRRRLRALRDVSSEGRRPRRGAQALSMGALFGLVNCAGIAPARPSARTARMRWAVRQGHPDQPGRQLQHDPPGRRGDGEERAEPTGERGVLINTASIAAFDGQIGKSGLRGQQGAAWSA